MKFLVIHSSIRWLFLFHALTGTVALALFLIPLLSKKGGKIHVRTGWIYVYAMIVVGTSALIITPWRVFVDRDRTTQSQSMALFLFFIAVFTLSAINYGIRALRLKKRKEPTHALSEIAPPVAVIILGLVTQCVGIRLRSPLLFALPFLAHYAMRKQLSYWLNAPTTQMHWWYAHMSGMFTACIATVTAFLVTAAPRLWPGPITSSPLIWVAPGLILGQFLTRWTAKYQAQFESTPPKS